MAEIMKPGPWYDTARARNMYALGTRRQIHNALTTGAAMAESMAVPKLGGGQAPNPDGPILADGSVRQAQ